MFDLEIAFLVKSPWKRAVKLWVGRTHSVSTLLSVDWRVEGYSGHSFPLFFLPGFFFLDDVSDGLSLPRVFPAPVKTMAVLERGWCHSKQLSEARGRLAVPAQHWADPVGAVSPGSRGSTRVPPQAASCGDHLVARVALEPPILCPPVSSLGSQSPTLRSGSSIHAQGVGRAEA